MVYMGRHMWNIFNVSCNISYFAYVSIMEDFQRIVFWSCESNGGFSTKLTKYDSFVHVHVIYRYTRLWKVPFIAWLGCSCMCLYVFSFLDELIKFSCVLDSNTRMSNTCVYPHQYVLWWVFFFFFRMCIHIFF